MKVTTERYCRKSRREKPVRIRGLIPNTLGKGLKLRELKVLLVGVKRLPVLVAQQKKEFERFERNVRWFQENYEKLKVDYAEEYVAVEDSRVVMHDKDARALIRRLRESYADIGTVVIEFVSKEKIELILN